MLFTQAPCCQYFASRHISLGFEPGLNALKGETRQIFSSIYLTDNNGTTLEDIVNKKTN